MLLCLGGIGVVFSGVRAAIQSSEPYQEGLKRAQANEEVQEALGTPIEPGMMPSGSINITTNSGSASPSVPVSGPKGDGTLYIRASKGMGPWSYEKLAVEIHSTGEQIDLLEDEE